LRWYRFGISLFACILGIVQSQTEIGINYATVAPNGVSFPESAVNIPAEVVSGAELQLSEP
jgi:hypothetical protein